MEICTKLIKVCFIIFINLYSNIYAQTSATTGFWTNGSTWIGGSSPTLSGGAGNLNSDVTIETGHTITLSGDLTVKNGVTLTVKGTLIISSGGDVDFENGSSILVTSSGTLEMNGLTNSNNSTDVTIHGNLIVNGNYTAGTGATLYGNGNMEISGSSSGSGSTFGTTLSCSDCAIDGTGTVENAIIDGSYYGHHAPIEPYWSWTYSQQIYYQSEIDQEGDITQLAFEYNGYSSYTDQVEIYLGHTTKSSFTSTSNWIPYSDLTLVYDGNYSVSSTKGWYWIEFDTPFTYNNTDNLVIAVYEKTSSYHSASDEFYVADGGLDRVLTYYDDYTNPDPASPPTANYKQEWIPSLKLTIGPSGGSPLPIELLSFETEAISNSEVEISWTSATELNNDYYTILKSYDGYHWSEIYEVDGQSTTTNITYYSWIDRNIEQDVIYYRLRQTDFDGKYEIFPISSVYIERRLYVVKRYNINGQECSEDYNGIIIEKWNNGEYTKVYQVK